jgi:hypothetical protein
MDWYIFLTPLLLLPIIFLFRLVGCGYPDFQYDNPEPPLINLTFKLIIVDPIPQILPNPIIYIWPKFTMVVDDGVFGPPIQYASTPLSLGQTAPPFTFISVPTEVPAGNHTCSCDVFMLRLDDESDEITPQSIDQNPDQLGGEHFHLKGPAIVDPPEGFVADTDITFNLRYTQTDPNQTDYVLDDFSLEQEPLQPTGP